MLLPVVWMAAWWVARADLPRLSVPMRDIEGGQWSVVSGPWSVVSCRLLADGFHHADPGGNLRHAVLRIHACSLDRAGEQAHDRVQVAQHRTGELAGDVGAGADLL